jgi:hypothetical protein
VGETHVFGFSGIKRNQQLRTENGALLGIAKEDSCEDSEYVEAFCWLTAADGRALNVKALILLQRLKELGKNINCK